MRTLRRPSFVLAALVAPIACARLAGLEDPDLVVVTAPGDGGTTSNGVFSVAPASISLVSSCNGGAPDQALTLANLTGGDLPFQLQVPDGSGFALRRDDGSSTLAREGTLHRSLQVRFTVDAKQAGSRDAALVVTVGESTMSVPVKVTVSGGALALSPTLIDFGEVRKDKPSAPQAFELRNTGTEAVNVLGFAGASGDAGTDFSVSLGGGTGSINVAPGGSVQGTVFVTSGPDDPQPIEATLQPTPQTATCGALPTLTLQGKRVNDDVTVNPVTLDFGNVDCASPGGASRAVTISNYGSQDAAFTATAGSASWFAVAPSSGTVPKSKGGAPGTATVTVSLKPVGSTLGDHQETLTIDVTGPLSKSTNVSVTAKSVGAVLDITPTTLTGCKPQGVKSFSLRNVGNTTILVQHLSSDGSFGLSPTQNLLLPGFPLTVNVKYNGSGSGSATATITTTRVEVPLAKNASLCLPAPTVTATTN